MTSATAERPRQPPRRRLAVVAYGTGHFDSRTFHVAQSAQAAGYEVVVYGRWEPGLPAEEWLDGYRIVRVPVMPMLAVPIVRRFALRRLRAWFEKARAAGASAEHGPVGALASPTSAMPGPVRPAPPDTGASSLPGLLRRAVRLVLRLTSNRWLLFPRRLIPFAIALDAVTEPADIWHGRLIGSLPAVVRQSRRLGGAAIYDSGDIYTKSRELAQDLSPYPRLVLWAERRWARACRLVMTANEDYADEIERLLGVPRPVVILNCSPRWTPPEPAPDRIRERLGLGPERRVVLYQGGLFTDRGIEQAMEAVLRLEGAVLAIMGWGTLREALTERATRPPYAGRVHMLDPVPPSELLPWSASADVMVICIQPTSPNHRLSTPNKLFEALAAGVPVVASDLPGMARVVRETGAGVLCDPTDPTAIAAAIRTILDAPAGERAALRSRILAAAHAKYSWEDQEIRLLEAYRRLLPEAGA